MRIDFVIIDMNQEIEINLPCPANVWFTYSKELPDNTPIIGSERSQAKKGNN